MSDALHQAVKQGNTEKVKKMVEEGADINSYSPSGLTPLHVLASSSNLDLLPFLIDLGGDVKKKAAQGSVYDGYGCLHFASERPHSRDLLSAFVEAGCDASEVDSLQRLPLHIAGLKGNLSACKVLVPLYPEAVNHQDQYGRTPLMLAGSQGHYQVVKYLIDCKGGSLDLADHDGNTALHHCFQVQSQPLFNYNYPLTDGHFQSAFDLVKAGVSIMLKNKDGDAAIDVINLALAEILEVVSRERGKLSQITSIEELISLDQKEIEELQLDSAIIPKMLRAIEVFSQVMERENALKKARGSCPFVDSSGTPEIRKFRKGEVDFMGVSSFMKGQEAQQGMGLTPQQIRAIAKTRSRGSDSQQILSFLAASALGASLVLAVAFVAVRLTRN